MENRIIEWEQMIRILLDIKQFTTILDIKRIDIVNTRVWNPQMIWPIEWMKPLFLTAAGEMEQTFFVTMCEESEKFFFKYRNKLVKRKCENLPLFATNFVHNVPWCHFWEHWMPCRNWFGHGRRWMMGLFTEAFCHRECCMQKNLSRNRASQDYIWDRNTTSHGIISCWTFFY